jgi:hypothetical protein
LTATPAVPQSRIMCRALLVAVVLSACGEVKPLVLVDAPSGDAPGVADATADAPPDAPPIDAPPIGPSFDIAYTSQWELRNTTGWAHPRSR